MIWDLYFFFRFQKFKSLNHLEPHGFLRKIFIIHLATDFVVKDLSETKHYGFS